MISHQKKAVVLITIDALRPDHLKGYGYHRNTAPNLEKFAKKGMTFLNAITNGPETPTSFSSIFTSILPFLDGGYSPLPNQKITLPQLLKENGILNYCIHSNPNLGRFFNYDRGFDLFLDGERYKTESNSPKTLGIKELLIFYLKKVLDYKDLTRKLMYRLKGFNYIKAWLRRKVPFLTDILLPFTPIAYNAPYVVTKTISILNNVNKPFFFWAHFMDVHSPYNPPSQNVTNFREKDFTISERDFLINKLCKNPQKFKLTVDSIENLKILYDSEINFIDEHLGKLLEFVNARFKDDCLVIVTADHGESFYEHGLFDHQGSVFEELLRVPLIFYITGKESIIKTVNETVQLLDIAPTILDYLGIEIPENFQGQSLLPLIEGKSIKKRKFTISECYQKSRLMKRNRNEGYILLSIRSDNWKYIFDEEKELELLFNLESDPQEKINLVKEETDKLAEFRAIKIYHLKKVTESFEEKLIISKSIDKLNLNKLK